MGGGWGSELDFGWNSAYWNRRDLNIWTEKRCFYLGTNIGTGKLGRPVSLFIGGVCWLEFFATDCNQKLNSLAGGKAQRFYTIARKLYTAFYTPPPKQTKIAKWFPARGLHIFFRSWNQLEMFCWAEMSLFCHKAHLESTRRGWTGNSGGEFGYLIWEKQWKS